jgi:hypothetical protein
MRLHCILAKRKSNGRLDELAEVLERTHVVNHVTKSGNAVLYVHPVLYIRIIDYRKLSCAICFFSTALLGSHWKPNCTRVMISLF